ncbi:hypothetical protein Cgig2_010124 [Carnegiea gigantea]|uniref:RNase H type-1 domain-containing protein n=1 Tax=Carnegiea gigantea TaxID=171969 RepID=A0A9Q1JQJ9_9CARY|nr:hypothetical protein Cgig2_010124 [Carnegiea gigantea]
MWDIEEMTTNAILYCLLAMTSRKEVASQFRNLADCLIKAREYPTQDEFGDFLAIMWECWNARNRFIFQTPDCHLENLGKRAIANVHSYRAQQDIDSPFSKVSHPSTRIPPATGYVKINFDGSSVRDMYSGWGFAICDHNGNLLLTSGKQMNGFVGAVIEEARACLYALKCAYNHGFCNIIIEGDSL